MNYSLFIRKLGLVVIAGLTMLGGILTPKAMQNTEFLGYSSPYISATGSDFDQPVVFGNTVTFEATSTFRDNVPACFGDYCDMSITYVTSGLPDLGFIGAPTSSNVVILGSQEFTRFDYVNASISAGNPTFLVTPASSTRNRFGSFSTNNTEFSVSALGGNDLSGTARDADGTNLNLRTPNGGSIGVNDGGKLQLTLGSGVGGGVDGYIISGGTVDMRFKNTSNGVFRIGDSESEAALTFDHNGLMGIVSSTVGEVHFYPKVSIGSGTGTFDARLTVFDTQQSNSALPVGLYVDQVYIPTGAGNSMLGGVIRGQIGASSTLSVFQLAGNESIAKNNGFGPVSDIVGQVNDGVHGGWGLVTNLSSEWVRIFVTSGGSIDNGIGTYYVTPSFSSTGTANDIYQIYMDPATGGTLTNYAFFYNNGSNSFVFTGGGQLVLGGTTTTNSVDNGTKVRLETFGVASTTRLIVSSSTQSGGGQAGQAMCWKADGKTLGYCSTVVDVGGGCTCN